MGFDAGTIKGRLDLDTTSFTHGFSEAHTHAETEGGRIREVLESLTEVFNEAMGPAVEHFGQTLRSVFAGFSEGPVIGVMGAIATAAGAVREAVEGAGGRFHQMGLEAEKAGVSAEFLSKLVGVAGTVGLGIEQVGTSFKILEQRVIEASEGNKQAEDGFRRLGISTQQAGELAKEPERLYETVTAALGRMTSASERQRAAGELMGRQGANLIPLFAMSREEFDKTGETIERLSGGVSESDVRMGESMGRLEAYFKAALEGIEKVVSKPILKYLEEHADEIAERLKQIVGYIVEGIETAWKILSTVIDEVRGHLYLLSPALDVLSGKFGELGPAAAGLVQSLMPLAEAMLHVASTVNNALLVVFDRLAGVVGPMVTRAIILITDALTSLFTQLGTHTAAVSEFANAYTVVAQVVTDLVIVAIAATEAVVTRLSSAFHEMAEIAAALLTKAFNELANSPLAPALEAIVTVFHKIGESIDWVIDKVSHLIESLHKLATTPHLFGTDVNTPATETPAEKSPERATEKKEPTAEAEKSENPSTTEEIAKKLGVDPKSISVIPAPEAEPAAEPKADATAEPKPKQAATRPAVKTVEQPATPAAGEPVIAAEPTKPASPPASKANVAKGGYNQVRTELTDATKGEDGLYHVKSSSAGGIGGALTQEQYDSLREREKARQGTGTAAGNSYVEPPKPAKRDVAKDVAAAGADFVGPDSIEQWKKYHPEEPDSIQKQQLSAQWRGPTQFNHPDQEQMNDAIAAGVPNPSLDAGKRVTEQASREVDAMLFKPPAEAPPPVTPAIAKTEQPALPQVETKAPPVAPQAVVSTTPPQARPKTSEPLAAVQAAPQAAPVVQQQLKPEVTIAPPATAAAQQVPPTPAAAPVAAGAAPAQADRRMTELSAAIDKLLAPIGLMEKSFSTVTIAADALKSGFESLHNNVNTLVSRMTESARQPAQQTAAAAAVTNNFTVNTQFDPRESVNQFAAKVLPAIRDLKRRQDDQLANAMATQLVAMSVGGGDE